MTCLSVVSVQRPTLLEYIIFLFFFTGNGKTRTVRIHLKPVQNIMNGEILF